jgi:adenosine deaminase
MENLIPSLEKGELHVHLNGLVSTKIIRELLLRATNDLPEEFCIDKGLNILDPAKDLASYLKPWQVLRLIPSSRIDLTLIVFNAFDNLKKQNITFVEIRNSVLYIALLNKITLDVALSWLLEDIHNASEKFNIKAGLILTVTRGDSAPEQLRVLLDAYKKLGKPKSVIGLDLAGDENIPVPICTSYGFVKAKEEFGLKITIHAGETGIVENIVTAVNDFKADRIGHGTSAIKSPFVLDLLRKNDICVEVCPISNRLTGAVAENESHPVSVFINNHVPFVICSDNPSIHSSNLSQDYFEFYRETSSFSHIENMLAMQKKYSFLKGLI